MSSAAGRTRYRPPSGGRGRRAAVRVPGRRPGAGAAVRGCRAVAVLPATPVGCAHLSCWS